jgi:hypothetical protein
VQLVITSGVNVSWLFIADYSELDTGGAVERERESNSRTVETGAAAGGLVWTGDSRWTGDSKESSGQVVLRHGPQGSGPPREGRTERVRGSILKFTQDTR